MKTREQLSLAIESGEPELYTDGMRERQVNINNLSGTIARWEASLAIAERSLAAFQAELDNDHGGQDHRQTKLQVNHWSHKGSSIKAIITRLEARRSKLQFEQDSFGAMYRSAA